MDVDRARRRAAGHVQRQPARGRGRARRAHRGAHARRVRRTSPRSAPASPTGCAKAIAEHGIPAHTVDLGAKGCVSYRPEPLRNYRDFLETHTELYDGVVPVDGQPRRVHDARATRSSGRSRCSTPRPTSTATSTRSPSSPPRSAPDPRPWRANAHRGRYAKRAVSGRSRSATWSTRPAGGSHQRRSRRSGIGRNAELGERGRGLLARHPRRRALARTTSPSATPVPLHPVAYATPSMPARSAAAGRR